MDDRRRRGHDQELFKKGFRLDVRKFAFSNKVVNDWHSLLLHCVIFISIHCTAINTVNFCTVNTYKIF